MLLFLMWFCILKWCTNCIGVYVHLKFMILLKLEKKIQTNFLRKEAMAVYQELFRFGCPKFIDVDGEAENVWLLLYSCATLF